MKRMFFFIFLGGVFFYFSLLAQNVDLRSLEWAINPQIDSTRVVRDITFFEDSIVVATWGQGIYFLDKKGKVKKRIIANEDLNSNRVNCFWKSKNRLWIGGFRGVNYYENKKVFSFYKKNLTSPVHALCEFQNNLYIGTVDKGVLVAKLEKGDFIFFNRNNGLKNDWINALLPYKNVIWVGTNFGIYQIFPDKTEKIYFRKLVQGPYTQMITSFIDVEDEIAILTGDGVICIWSKKIRKIISSKKVSSLPLNCGLFFEGKYILGTNKGVIYYDKKSDFIVKDKEMTKWVKCLKVIKGKLYLGTYEGEIYLKTTEGWKLFFVVDKK